MPQPARVARLDGLPISSTGATWAPASGPVRGS